MPTRDVGSIGFGTYSLTGPDGVEAIATALDVGYRHLDTARLYGNQEEVGDAIEAASDARDDVFVATKICHFEEPEPTREYIREGIEDATAKLGVDTIDLLYHHWPRRLEDVEIVLPVFEQLVAEGTVDRIGVSNYTRRHLELARDAIDEPIFANQVECHPLLRQDELLADLRTHDTYLVAYSPIAQGAVFDVPELTDVAEKHETNEAVVSLAWNIQRKGVIPIPRSSSTDHIRTNYEALELSLDDEDVELIESVETSKRCEDPSWMKW